MPHSILALNVGSSSIKFALFVESNRSSPAPSLSRLASGAIQGMRQDTAQLILKLNSTKTTLAINLSGDMAFRVNQCLPIIFSALTSELSAHPLIAVGHRVVHGGLHFTQAEQINPESLAHIEELIPLAPLHEPFNLLGIRAVSALYPDLPQTASFDTAFHSAQPRLHRLFGLPRALADEGIIRYGFHGLSYDFIAHQLPVFLGAMPRRAIVAHLGSGASVCALRDGQSLGSSLGFSTLDGLIMSTRCGQLDAGVVLHLLQAKKMSVDAVHQLLYHQSGLLGLSGQSSEMHELLALVNSPTTTDDNRTGALLAINLFCHRASLESSAWLNALGGLDALIFTGGIGEHAPKIRQTIAQSFSWMGLILDEEANDKAIGQTQCISTPQSRVAVWVIPTDEEQVIAEQALALIEN